MALGDHNAAPQGELALGDRVIRIGRGSECDVVLDSRNVSRVHAEVEGMGGGEFAVRDLDSRNGTKVNGSALEGEARFSSAVIRIGDFELRCDGTRLRWRDARSDMSLRGEGISIKAGGKTILQPLTIEVRPGEMTVIVGESGAGKSTLLKTLAGVHRPATGEVTVNGQPLALMLPEIGYTPQDEVVHPALTVEEALGYAAKLRLPSGTDPGERRRRMSDSLEQLGLTEHASTRIGSLSGGQRKRAGVAPELLSEPSLLLLDEPTTGLDPGLERRMMEQFRSLADSGKGVVVVTHATRSLELADRLIVMAAGGIMTYDGSPEGALAAFGVEEYDLVYQAVTDRGGEYWRDRSGMRPVPGKPAPPRPRSGARRVNPLSQAATLTSRYATLTLRDWRNMILVLGAPPALAMLEALLFAPGAFDADRTSNSLSLLFMLTIVSVYAGSVAGVREIVKERAVMMRESAVGVGIGPYLGSKLAVLAVVAALQTAGLCAVAFWIQPVGLDVAGYLKLSLIFYATALVGAAMGLAISALARNEDQATSVIPILLTPQMIFGGSIVTVAAMREPLDWIAATVFSRWSYAGAGNVIDANERIAADEQFSTGNPFGADYFELTTPETLLILAGFLGVFTAITWALTAAAANRA